ncbi:MAG: sigma-70 family RNA polymerase sigma factor [Planctomycetes bacterium]|nr:sigma-70 family RNA polymerase sigma factor [Planctomycetota bacterium]
MALSEIDKNLIDRCLARKPGSWEDFVDRFLGLVTHVVNHTAQSRGIKLAQQDREDLCADVFLALVRDDFAVMRHFRRQCSLSTYLTVVSRRVAVRELLQKKTLGRLSLSGDENIAVVAAVNGQHEQRIADQEEVNRLLDGLQDADARVVRLYHLEGLSYQEISAAVGMPENSIGPTLSRARERLRSRANA